MRPTVRIYPLTREQLLDFGVSESAIVDLQYMDVEYLETVGSTFSSNLEQLKEIYLTDLVDPKDLRRIVWLIRAKS